MTATTPAPRRPAPPRRDDGHGTRHRSSASSAAARAPLLRCRASWPHAPIVRSNTRRRRRSGCRFVRRSLVPLGRCIRGPLARSPALDASARAVCASLRRCSRWACASGLSCGSAAARCAVPAASARARRARPRCPRAGRRRSSRSSRWSNQSSRASSRSSYQSSHASLYM